MIRQPEVILGNREALVTMGERGELLTFFYPSRDRWQHVSDSYACIHTGGELLRQDSGEWEAEQRYQGKSNIVNTRLTHPSGIEMTVRDFVHPDMPVLIRNYAISAANGLDGKLFYYSDLQAGESHNRNSAFCDTDAGLLVQYNREFHIGLAGKPGFEEWQIGRVTGGWPEAAAGDMQDGKLQGNREEIGNLDNVIGWKLGLAPGETANYTVYLGAAQGRVPLYALMGDILQKDYAGMLDETEEYWKRWLSKKLPLSFPAHSRTPLPGEISEMYDRSLLCLSLLNDPESGAFIAAPEFDPDFEMCGGYGYCWNRDSAAVVLALLKAGYPEYCGKFTGWCKQTQLPDGSWFQRYWLDGREAPSWGNFDDSAQIDETGSTLHAIERYYRSLEGNRKTGFLKDMRDTVLRGGGYLEKRSATGMHDPCRCLWESDIGVFSYTNAAVYAGLTGAARMAAECGEQHLAGRWLERAALIRKNTIERMWLKEGYFAKGIIDGRTDATVDASMLGTFVPFNMISAEKPQEREMILSMIRHIETRLGVAVNGYSGIKRYENDSYIGGNPWTVTTLWLAEALLCLACRSKTVERDILVNRALEYIQWVLGGTTGTGMIPEQVDRETGKPAWAIPLSWSCALMIENALLLDGAGKSLHEK